MQLLRELTTSTVINSPREYFAPTENSLSREVGKVLFMVWFMFMVTQILVFADDLGDEHFSFSTLAL